MGNIEKITEKQKDDIKEKYINGESLKSLGKKYKCRNSDIRDLISNMGIEIRGKGKQVNKENYRTNIKYSLNESYFENIDSFEKAYWLGFLFADGCVRNERKRRTLELCLKTEDMYHINNLSSALGSEAMAKEKIVKLDGKEYSSHRCVWSSEKLVTDLERHGCVQNKSLILEFPKNISKEFLPEFIRGYFEGDGCIYCYVYNRKENTVVSRGIQILGTEVFCLSLQNILKQYGIKANFRNLKDRNCSELRVQSKNGIRMFYKIMYENCKNNRVLLRKKDKFEEMIQNNYL